MMDKKGVGRVTGVCYLAGAMPISPALRPVTEPDDLLIAADRGYERLSALGLTADLVVGDFDSLGAPPDHPAVTVLPVVKDDTDLLYAARQGLERGYRRFVLLGCAGGRIEHTVANLQTLDFLAAHGARGVLAGEDTVAAVLRNGALTFPAPMTGSLSVFCVSGRAEGVTLTNLKYELTGHTLTGEFPLGVSNEFTGRPAAVRVERGSLLLLWREQGNLYDLLPHLWG